MTEDQLELLQEARESIKASKLLLEHGHANYAASRAYYSMFYVAQAFLEGQGLAFSKHSAVIAAFGQHFVKTGRVPIEFHRYLLDAQQLRLTSDYGPSDQVSIDKAQEQISRAEAFLALAERLIGPIPTDKEPLH